MKNFKGIFTALLTPFDATDAVNEKELRRLIDFNLDMGVNGFYVTGSTGEAFMLTTEERMRVMEIVRDAAPASTLIAHVGSVDERAAVRLAAHAAHLGYDLVSSVSPFYYKFSFREIREYYERVADAAGIPMLVYHIPAFSGVNMGVGEMDAFLSDSRFIGIKYTSNDFFTMESCKSLHPDKLIYNGYDEMLLAGLAMGADGAIGSTYNFMADKFVKIYSLFAENRIDEARAVQQEANRIITILCDLGVMQAEKEVLCQLGFDFGECRRPFGELNEEQKGRIAREIIPHL